MKRFTVYEFEEITYTGQAIQQHASQIWQDKTKLFWLVGFAKTSHVSKCKFRVDTFRESKPLSSATIEIDYGDAVKEIMS